MIKKCFPVKKPTGNHRDCECNKKVIAEIKKLGRLIMATKQEVLDAIAAEKAEVVQSITDLNAQIQALKDQIESGSPVTSADLDEIAAAVNDIFVPPVA